MSSSCVDDCVDGALQLRFRQIRRKFLMEPIAKCKQRQKTADNTVGSRLLRQLHWPRLHRWQPRIAAWSAFRPTGIRRRSATACQPAPRLITFACCLSGDCNAKIMVFVDGTCFCPAGLAGGASSGGKCPVQCQHQHQRWHQSQQRQRDKLQSGRKAASQSRLPGCAPCRLPRSVLRLSGMARKRSLRDRCQTKRRPCRRHAPHQWQKIVLGMKSRPGRPV